MTSELRPAALVAHEVCEEMEEYGPAFAERVIKADREAVRAEQAAELAKWKALAETLAGAVREIKDSWDWWQVDTYDRCSSVVEDAINEALREYNEARDAS